MTTPSRPNQGGRNTEVDLEDGMFWSDWILAGGWALGASVVAAAHSGRPVGEPVVWLAFITILAGGLGFPMLLRQFAYDPKTIQPKSLKAVLIANVRNVLSLRRNLRGGAGLWLKIQFATLRREPTTRSPV